MSSQVRIQKASSEAEQNKIETDLLKLKERVAQIYFGILLLNEQLIQTNLIKEDIHSSLKKT